MDQILQLADGRIEKAFIRALKRELQEDKIPLDKILKELAKQELVGLSKEQLEDEGIDLSTL